MTVQLYSGGITVTPVKEMVTGCMYFQVFYNLLMGRGWSSDGVMGVQAGQTDNTEHVLDHILRVKRFKRGLI